MITLDIMKSRRLVVVFILGSILLNYPILSLFNVSGFLFGIPILYLYAFSIWLLLILLTVFISISNNKPPHAPDHLYSD